MKTTLFTCLCSAALAVTLFAQDPTVTPAAAAAGAPAALASPAAATASPAAQTSVTPAADDRSDLERRIQKKVKHGLNISFGDDDEKSGRKHDVHVGNSDSEEAALMAIPIVGIIFTTLFGAPVLVVGLIMFFSYWKARSLHRTVRMMVEKGQPVPEALFATPHSPARARSDMRRGVVLIMIGLGLMIFLGAVNDWQDGSWAVGIIPFLIGAGYLLVWKLEGAKRGTDIPPRVS